MKVISETYGAQLIRYLPMYYLPHPNISNVLYNFVDILYFVDCTNVCM